MQICLKAIASWPTGTREVFLSGHWRRVQIPRPAAAFSRKISSIRIWRRNVPTVREVRLDDSDDIWRSEPRRH